MRKTIGLTIWLVASPAIADQASRSIRDVTPITNGSGAVRVLFKTGLLGELGNVAIREARVSFSTEGTLEARRLNLRVHPVTTAWTPGAVDWTAGWTRPGGDFDDLVYSRVELDLSRGRSEVNLDLTLALKEILEDGMFTDGFIVTVDPDEGAGIRTDDLPRLAALGSAAFEITYRNVPARPARSGERTNSVRNEDVAGDR